ncbi:UDP-4-amino-4,6-dideoxy-N-acetyl-beta-L-altrosamine N-acetyltransferase [Leekyejoonella antrihumi]|uniref:UDP-4-amino-4, 6-dideoxy-N-acetyl-beta-L-altrosamine N-acetyltransferase n=1 Tax=Leekyejoonella antrihumi TaxID=1660198 RepID=A0A563DXY9_9MICO|nr:UDP-4-amino-4,6-dideoxy-N-acetyl-beta-L-altrosamine N-acetyltransferase [Leekyejoonella antrihumi]TWP35075.1 UDP-4-amino-4,6-dideoxy-N-acetyl-beta-L-altrosamine N-acetyltransferase [Leekyejoonella antrihumi]
MLRPAREADKEVVRLWRNHPQVRAVSLTRDEITPQMHDAWWDAVQSDDTRQVLIYVRHGVRSGVVNFFDIDHKRRSAMWGYYLDNEGLELRGETLPAWIEIQRQAVKYADAELALDTLSGEVLDQNAAVRRMNRRNGFEEIDTQEREIDGTTVIVHTIRRTHPSATRQS